MKLYFYCVMKNFKKRTINLKSIDNQKIIFIRSNDLFAAVSYTKYTGFDDSPENLKIHEKIIHTFSKNTPVIPFLPNTIVGDTIGNGVLYAHYTELKKLINKIGEKQEFCVRILKDTDRKLADFFKLSKIKQSKNDIQVGGMPRPGKKMYNIAGHKVAARIHNQFVEVTEDSQYERLVTEERLMEGYYLVNNNNISSFKEKFKWVKSLYPELCCLLEGPNLPYHFNTVDITSKNKKLHGEKHPG